MLNGNSALAVNEAAGPSLDKIGDSDDSEDPKDNPRCLDRISAWNSDLATVVSESFEGPIVRP